MAAKKGGGLITSMKVLLESETHADLIIRCHGTERKVHKAIVSARCDFFKVACENGRWLEGTEGVISFGCKTSEDCANAEDLEDTVMCIEDSDSLNMLLLFLYTDDYHLSPGMMASKSLNRLNLHAKMFAIADKYNLPDLLAIATTKFEHAIHHECFDDIICEAVRTAYHTTMPTVPGLRQIILTRFHKLQQGGHLTPSMHAVVCEINDLAHGLWTKGTSDPGPSVCQMCKTYKETNCTKCTKDPYHNGRGYSIPRVLTCSCAGVKAICQTCSDEEYAEQLSLLQAD